MSYGSAVGNGKHDVAQGFDLLAKTVSKLTGIKKFDAGAIINFNGFKEIVDAMDGVTMTIDQNVKSEHLQPNGKPRDAAARVCGQHLRAPVHRAAGGVQEGHLPPARPGRRSTTYASATACRAATTTASGTSSSSSRPWPRRR